MSDIENVNAVISELEQINDWLCKINEIDNQIEVLPSKKEREIRDINSKYVRADNVNDYLERLPSLSSLIDVPAEDFVPLLPPKHWRDTNVAEDKECEEIIEKWLSNEGKEKLYNVFREYDKFFLSVTEECDTEYNRVKAIKASKLDEIEKKYENISNELIAQKEHLQNQLKGTTLIPEELFEEANGILKMLKLKRADTLKEAINLVFDEKRKDEEEAQRREEAARQEAILEEQAWDNRMHNEEMERAIQEEARAMREHNEKMEQAAERSARDQADAMVSQRAANQARCWSCAKSGTCSYERKQANICQAYVRK